MNRSKRHKIIQDIRVDKEGTKGERRMEASSSFFFCPDLYTNSPYDIRPHLRHITPVPISLSFSNQPPSKTSCPWPNQKEKCRHFFSSSSGGVIDYCPLLLAFLLSPDSSSPVSSASVHKRLTGHAKDDPYQGGRAGLAKSINAQQHPSIMETTLPVEGSLAPLLNNPVVLTYTLFMSLMLLSLLRVSA